MGDKHDDDSISRRIQEIQQKVDAGETIDDCKPLVEDVVDYMKQNVEDNKDQILDNFEDRSLETVIRADGLDGATKEETLEFLKKAEDILKKRQADDS